MLFFQIQAAKIVKGERRDKRKRSFLAWLCRAASYLRKTKIVKITHIYTIYFCKETKEGTDLLKKFKFRK